MKLHMLSISLAFLGLLAVSNQEVAATDVHQHSLTHPESMVKGYLGKGRVVTGHDAYGNAIIESASCPSEVHPGPC